MRGSNTLFADIFEAEPISKQKRGRNRDLHDQRNKCLIERYYYYGQVHRLNFVAILEILEKEFFVSKNTIPYLIGPHRSHLQKLKQEKPSLKYFKQNWPHLSW